MYKKIVLLFFAFLLSLIMSGIVLEIWCRLNDVADLQIAGHSGLNCRPAAFRPAKDIRLGWEFEPKYYGISRSGYPLNSLGMPDKEYTLKKSPGIYRILVVGDSITEAGWYVKYLEMLLNDSNLPFKFEVLNCGVGGYSITQYYYFLKDKVPKLHPDMVIIGFCMNDMESMNIVALTRYGTYMYYSNPLLLNLEKNDLMYINKTLFFHSNAYRFFIFLSQKDHKAVQETPAYISWQALNMIIELTKQSNVKLFATVIPYFKKNYSAYEQTQYDLFLTYFVKSKIKYLDLHDSFQNIDDLSWRDDKNDFIHPSEKGHKIIAKKIYDYLMANTGYWCKNSSKPLKNR